MSRNKFNLKDKKKKIIISIIVLCIILLGSLGFGLAILNSTESKDIAYTKNKIENKKEGTSSKEETKTESINMLSVENKTENKEETSSESTNLGTTSDNTSKDTGSESKPSTGGGSTSNNTGSNLNSKPSNGGSSNTGGSSNSKPSNGGGTSNSGGSSNNGGTSNSGGTSKPEAHTHNWVAVTEQVHHDEQGHWEEYVVSQAWTEEVPVYEQQARDICNTCGADITGTDISAHVKKHMMAGEATGGHRTEWVQVQTGTNKIEHPAVTDKKWVVDKSAWTETVTTGYKCSGCGATK